MDSWVGLLTRHDSKEGGGDIPLETLETQGGVNPPSPLGAVPGQQAKVESSLQTLQVFVAGFIFQSANSCLLPPEFFDSAGPVVGPFSTRIFVRTISTFICATTTRHFMTVYFSINFLTTQ